MVKNGRCSCRHLRLVIEVRLGDRSYGTRYTRVGSASSCPNSLYSLCLFSGSAGTTTGVGSAAGSCGPGSFSIFADMRSQERTSLVRGSTISDDSMACVVYDGVGGRGRRVADMLPFYPAISEGYKQESTMQPLRRTHRCSPMESCLGSMKLLVPVR
jgi:hypothetical protein